MTLLADNLENYDQEIEDKLDVPMDEDFESGDELEEDGKGDSGEESFMEDSDLEDQALSDNDDDDNNEQPETENTKNDLTDTVETTTNPNKKKKKKSGESKKVGAHRQKKLIHTLLKRAKIYEIRKLTRRVKTLSSAKGTAEQIEKNKRKVERLSQEITCIREFMIDQLTDRMITIFKKKAEGIDAKMWESCETPSKTNDLIQVLTESKEEGSLNSVAFLKMMSSKDVLCKFQRISKGESLTTKPKKKKGKGNKPPNSSTGARPPMKTTQKTENESTEGAESAIADNSNSKIKSSENKNKSNDKGTVAKPQKKTVMKKDSFFVDHEVEANESDLDGASDISDEEFTAPVMFDSTNPDIQLRKKNRMGQRDRKRLQDIKHGRQSSDVNGFYSRGRGRGGAPGRFSRDRNFGGHDRRNFNSRSRGGGFGRDGYNRGSRGGRGDSRGRGRGDFRGRSSTTRGSGNFTRKAPIVAKKVDETLHPSWQAKQKQKAQQGIGGFAGTKITFED